jgi:hypothetical protein
MNIPERWLQHASNHHTSSRFEVEPTTTRRPFGHRVSNDIYISNASENNCGGRLAWTRERSEGNQGVGLLIPCPKGRVGSKCLGGKAEEGAIDTIFPLPALLFSCFSEVAIPPPTRLLPTALTAASRLPLTISRASQRRGLTTLTFC